MPGLETTVDHELHHIEQTNRLEDVRVAPAYPIDEVLRGDGKLANL